ncbi:zinc-finger domain-containing protein [Paenibacillus lycopersici]|uniref:Zinc-finger domain-containing protein n=1 Tax=Paenibacillus lycopersici TaxID=2704462 RepID=A0A6C0FV23_9BACL|nr:zinc-finger domain-containing protein [Paenibacillus lycopersici]QHT60657.1 zinc-finger domain-containing protein [Paenibacillus lycopersici]
MKRTEAITRIGALLDQRCAVCPTRDAMNQQYKTAFSRIDGYCNRECLTGRELQALGKQLTLRSRKKIDESDEQKESHLEAAQHYDKIIIHRRVAHAQTSI